jgi:hypothetical protein
METALDEFHTRRGRRRSCGDAIARAAVWRLQYRSGTLIDAAEGDLVRATLERLPF